MKKDSPKWTQCTLAASSCESLEVQLLAEELQQCMEEWGITVERLCCVTTDSRAKIVSAIRALD